VFGPHVQISELLKYHRKLLEIIIPIYILHCFGGTEVWINSDEYVYSAFVEGQYLLNRQREELVALKELKGLLSLHESLPIVMSRKLTSHHATKACLLSRHENLRIITSRKLAHYHVTKANLLSRHESLHIIMSRKLTSYHVTKAFLLSRHESLPIMTSRKLAYYHVTKACPLSCHES